MYGYVSGLPAFLAYFGTGAALIIAFALLYSLVTPHREFSLVRDGNVAAATAWLGAMVGFSLPLASAAANSVSIVDFIIWAAIGGIVQLAAFGIAAAAQKGLSARITAGETAAGLWAGGVALITGLLNAACMTY
jgi:putative membrane protein